jgi:DNA-binding transcriptional LysR family regulator
MDPGWRSSAIDSNAVFCGLMPSLLTGDYSDLAIRPVKEAVPRRDVYALLPPGDRHPRARQVAELLLETAAEFDR